MRVSTIIEILVEYAEKYGDEADIQVYDYEGTMREEVYLQNNQIATNLTSRGPEVDNF